MDKSYFKHCVITPKVVPAGDSVEFRINLILGRDFTVQGSRLVLDMPAYLGYSRPSKYDQEDGGYFEVFCSNPDILYLERTWDMEVDDFPTKTKTSFKGMAQRLIVIDFLGGECEEDDQITIKWGYTRDGMGIGTKVSCVVLKKDFMNTIHVRYFTDSTKGLPDFGRSFKGYDRPVPDVEVPLSYKIIPREPEKIRVIRNATKSGILLLDRFSNVSYDSEGPDFFETDEKAEQNEYGVYILKNKNAAVRSRSLPLTDTPVFDNVFSGMNIYFGDLHTHSNYSNDCIEREKMEMEPDMMYSYGKNVSMLDFMAVTDHHQPWDIERNKIGREKWEKTVYFADEHNKPGEFVAFPGFEFRDPRGDTAVVFCDAPTYERIDNPGFTDVRKLWDGLNGLNYITIPHFHNPGSLDADEWYECPYEGIEPVLEIYSCHGSYEAEGAMERRIPLIKRFRKDRNGHYFLKNGYRYGFTCNSDGHKGNPGCNGLTAVYARELTRESILNAIRKRQVYGTTNARIKLLFTINGSLMGSVIPRQNSNEIYIHAEGEMPFKAIDIFRNGERIKRYKPYTKTFSEKLKFEEFGPANYYVRVMQVDNHMAYSSPIWLE